MKKQLFIITAMLLFFANSSFAQSKSVEALYQKYKSNENFFHFDVGGSFMNFAKGFNIQLQDGHKEAIANSMERLKMFKLPVNSQIAKSEFKALQKGLEKERFDLTMELHEKRNGISIYTKGQSKISDIVVLVQDDEGEVMVFELQGNFDSKMLSEVTKSSK